MTMFDIIIPCKALHCTYPRTDNIAEPTHSHNRPEPVDNLAEPVLNQWKALLKWKESDIWSLTWSFLIWICGVTNFDTLALE